MNRIRDLCRPQAPCILLGGRGSAWQEPARQREQILRDNVAELSIWATAQGYATSAMAGCLRLSPRTLRQWCHDHRQAGQQVHWLGRPVLHAPVAERSEVLAVIHALGLAIGVPTLRECFPHMLRAELADLLIRCRRVWRRRYHTCLQVLHWLVPGGAWAIDFGEPPHPVDGLYPYLLAVRDLASGRSLLWRPLKSATAIEAILALAPLFAIHGAPLVLKADNGSPFRAALMQAFLEVCGVIPLYSPPRMPRYNGAIEAGIGSLKTRTEEHATWQGHAAEWTCDDVEAARAEANATARPRGPSKPTPDEAWQARHRLSREEREHFRAVVDQHRQRARGERGWPAEASEAWPPSHEDRSIDRVAIPRTLVECGYLLYRRRRIPLPFSKPKAANIT